MKVVIYWVLAILITFAAIVYQRATGPTYHKKVSIEIDNQVHKFELIRSHGGESDAKIELDVPDQGITGQIMYRLYPTNKEWITINMERQYDNLSGYLPYLPPAGKYEYHIVLQKDGKDYHINPEESILIRFKGEVPGSILIPHIFFMFFAMLLGNLAGIMAIFKHNKFRLLTNLTVIAIILGGMILGPWVQWYAFGEFWAGVPFAWDLTDNKTLVAVLFWVFAFFMNRKKERPVYTIIASIIMLLVYSIPHSMHGSQLDPESGVIIQGWIHLWIW